MFGREPTLIIGFIRALIICGVAFGLDLTPEQIGGIYLAVEAFLSLVNRQQVYPVADLDA